MYTCLSGCSGAVAPEVELQDMVDDEGMDGDDQRTGKMQNRKTKGEALQPRGALLVRRNALCIQRILRLV